MLLFDLEKGKAGAKGVKTTSPILDGPNESDTTRPLDSEEIQALAIRFDELEKVWHQLRSLEYNFFRLVTPRKTID
jgi:hypothetical protein